MHAFKFSLNKSNVLITFGYEQVMITRSDHSHNFYKEYKIEKKANTDLWTYQRWDQIHKESNYPLWSNNTQLSLFRTFQKFPYCFCYDTFTCTVPEDSVMLILPVEDACSLFLKYLKQNKLMLCQLFSNTLEK